MRLWPTCVTGFTVGETHRKSYPSQEASFEWYQDRRLTTKQHSGLTRDVEGWNGYETEYTTEYTAWQYIVLLFPNTWTCKCLPKSRRATESRTERTKDGDKNGVVIVYGGNNPSITLRRTRHSEMLVQCSKLTVHGL